MPKYTGSVSSSAGGLITVFDTELVKHSNWSIYDASAGTNAKVYQCYDADLGVEWYLYVDDNQSNYAKIRTWSSWNATTHAGSGKNTAQCYFFHTGPNYVLVLRGKNLVWVNSEGASDRHGHYVGELLPLYQGAHFVACLGYNSTSPGASGSPLTSTPYTTDVFWHVWCDNGGSYDQVIQNCLAGASSPIGAQTRYILDTNGYAHIQEEYLYCDKLCIGQLDGVMMLLTTPDTFGDGDTIDVDGVEWEVYLPSTSFAVLIRNS